jgi:hypothetical protein
MSTTAPAPAPGIGATADYDEADELARQIHVIDGCPPRGRSDADWDLRTVCVHRLTWLLLQGIPLPH